MHHKNNLFNKLKMEQTVQIANSLTELESMKKVLTEVEKSQQAIIKYLLSSKNVYNYFQLTIVVIIVLVITGFFYNKSQYKGIPINENAETLIKLIDNRIDIKQKRLIEDKSSDIDDGIEVILGST